VGRHEKPLKLPIEFDEALCDLLKVKPAPEGEAKAEQKRTKKAK
jgi:hypothetical protein